jgi:hypothetical protein
VTALKVILQAIVEVQLQLPPALVEDAARRVHRCIESRFGRAVVLGGSFASAQKALGLGSKMFGEQGLSTCDTASRWGIRAAPLRWRRSAPSRCGG